MSPERAYSILFAVLAVLFLILCHCTGIQLIEP